MSNKKICSTVCLSLVMTAGAVPAAAQSGFFIVGSVGHSATKLSPMPLPEITDEDQSLELGIGYAFNPYFAIQAGYQDFGQATETLELECPPCVSCLPPDTLIFVADHEDAGEDLIYEAGLRWHVSQRWSLQVSYEEVNLDIESTKLGAMFRF